MASKAGPRAMGTDGSDFLHRERVAPHYKISSANKYRLKCILFLHLMLWIFMLFRLSTSFFVMAGMRPPTFLQKLRLPKAQFWEFWWLGSILASVIAFTAMPRNRAYLMKHFLLGTLTFGFLPIFYAIYDLADDLLAFWESRESKLLFGGFPVVVLWNMFLVISLQIHGFASYFGWQLVKAWRPRVAKKMT